MENKVDKTTVVLRLYIAGMTPTASRALLNLKKIISDFKNNHQYKLEVVDISEKPQLAENEKILATPVAIRHLPLPIRKVVGDFSDKEQVLIGLDLIGLDKVE